MIYTDDDNIVESGDVEDTKSDTVTPEIESQDENSEENVTANSDVADEQKDTVTVPNYEEIIAEDIKLLKAEFPELYAIEDITELENPLRYAALRDLGLSAQEAYLATTRRKRQDTRSHLQSAYGRRASAPTNMMSQQELSRARDLFGDLSDAEIQRLYKKVTT
jgi:hypothetical protein